ncbi:hypothetical protein [Spirillospora sp. CA-294931]|uniref:hypothetical protein n=1 Tax=Spirillospora sp. CA-294931 TaxID=3240042 RepID=UPI003D9457B4
MTADEVYDLMNRAGELPYGEARTVLVEDALRRAEATGDERLAFGVRMALTTAYQYGGEPARAFTTFSRCLAEHDRDPARFDEEHRLLWHFKWIVNSLTLFPEIPLDRTYAVLDDMERRYRQGGHSLQAVYHYRHVVARHVGDDAEADAWFARWAGAERDELSDCEGCDPTGKVRHLASRGSDEEALAVAAPVLNAELDCSEQPQSILTALLPVYLRTGRAEEARDAHRRGYRLVRSSLADLSEISEHLRFCAVTGNEARGMEILQRHLGWLDRAPSPYAAMRFAAAGALLLRRLDELGVADEVTVRRRPGDEVGAAELRAELAGQALELAARFDARNGGTRQGEHIRRIMESEPVVEHLPLTPHARRPEPAARPAAVPEVTDPDALLDLAESHHHDRDDAAAAAVLRRFDELVGDDELTPSRRARRADARGRELSGTGDLEAAVTEWELAARLYQETGDPVRQHVMISRNGAINARLGQHYVAYTLLSAATEYLDREVPDSREAIGARLRLADGHLRGDRLDDARSVLDETRPQTPRDIGQTELLRSQVCLRANDLDGALASLRRSREVHRDEPPFAAEAAFQLGQLLTHVGLRHAGDGPALLDEAESCLDEAVASGGFSPMLRLAAHAERGNLLLARERAADAVPDLVEAVAGFTAASAYPQAAYARVDLAAAYYTAGRHLEAAEVAEEALAILGPDADPDIQRRCRMILAHAQRELGEEQAAETFTGLAEDAEHPGAAGELLEQAGDLLTSLDKDGLAADKFAAAAEAFAKAGEPYGVVRTHRRAGLCRLWSGQNDLALAEMALAREGLAELPRDNVPALTWETSLVAYDEARLLANLERYDEALPLTAEAHEGFVSLDETDAAEAVARLRSSIEEELA